MCHSIINTASGQFTLLIDCLWYTFLHRVKCTLINKYQGSQYNAQGSHRNEKSGKIWKNKVLRKVGDHFYSSKKYFSWILLLWHCNAPLLAWHCNGSPLAWHCNWPLLAWHCNGSPLAWHCKWPLLAWYLMDPF